MAFRQAQCERSIAEFPLLFRFNVYGNAQTRSQLPIYYAAACTFLTQYYWIFHEPSLQSDASNFAFGGDTHFGHAQATELYSSYLSDRDWTDRIIGCTTLTNRC